MYMYIDLNWKAHACPFCQTTSGNCFDESIENTILKIQKKGYPAIQDIQMGLYDT